MKQLLQNLADGKTLVQEVPCPQVASGQLLIKSTNTLVSSGTERMLVEFGKANWLRRVQQQPDKVRMVLEKAATDGIAATVEAVRSKLDQPLVAGYCNVGVVQEIGLGVEGLAAGDRVVSNGPHAEIVCVPKNLAAKIPEDVSDEQAAFTVLGAIGLQGIRLANPSLGECVVVTGLGLVGLLVVQILRANGCRVMGVDPDSDRLSLALQFGAEMAVNPTAGEDVLAAANKFSRGRGVDAVIIAASTKSNDPVSQAAQMCRKRGRIVLVGVTGLELNRADFYEKELSFQVSCSYGPGRYDPDYEEKGQDYPIGFVRWTEQRNFEAVLDMMADGRLDVEPLISHRFKIDEAEKAYELLGSDEPSLGILLEYDSEGSAHSAVRSVALDQGREIESVEGRPKVSFLGAGNYAGRTLMPLFRDAGVTLSRVVTSGGVNGVHYGKKFGFAEASTDPGQIFDSDDDAIVIATRHNSHAAFVIKALEAGKHVFVEKPLCLTLEELAEIEAAYANSNALLTVGFNRRFAPHVQKIKDLLDKRLEPATFVMTVNAGKVPADHWTQDAEVGGGRIIGEACHFVDLLRYLAGAAIVEAEAVATSSDIVTLSLRFANGSIGTVHYLANGHRSFPKERLEIFCGGRILQLDNFRKLKGYGWPGFRTMNLWRQDKGQKGCVAAFVNAVTGKSDAPIPFDEIIEVSRITIELAARATGKL